MSKKWRLIISTVALSGVIFGLMWYRPWRPAPLTVGLVSWLNSGAVVGSSELHAGDLFLEETPDSRIQTVSVDDEWDPAQSTPAIAAAMQKGTHFFISSHPSNCAVASSSLFATPDALIINTASTSPALTGQDDYFLRIVADADQEQRALARYIHEQAGDRLLVLQDTGNLPYTEPAFATFSAELTALGKWEIVHYPLRVTEFNPDDFQALMAEDFDMLYILAGSFQAAIGNIAQLFNYHHPTASIMLTPWARSPAILEIAGPAVAHLILPSQYPSRHTDAAIDAYFRRFQARYGYEPHAMTIGVRQALELLEQAFAQGYRTPTAVKTYLLTTPVHLTSLGPISFDPYGDVHADFYFITDVEHELR